MLELRAEAVTVGATLIAEIRAEMARQRLTQTELARRLGHRQDWLSRRLTGRVELNLGEIDAIAGVLGVPAARLLRPAARSATG